MVQKTEVRRQESGVRRIGMMNVKYIERMEIKKGVRYAS